LTKVQAELRQQCRANASWVAAENLHVTLKFLGEVPENQVAEICKALAAAPIPQTMHLRVAGIECFSSRGAVRTIVANLSGDVEPLCALQEKIEICCSALGFVREKRAYVPHVTLARIKSRLTDRDWAAAYHTLAGPEFDADGFLLMESRLGSRGAAYQRVAGFGVNCI
jgi:2'-5' RNA ligase